jgi:hypothetical protein
MCHPVLITEFLIVKILELLIQRLFHHYGSGCIDFKVEDIRVNQRKESLVRILIINSKLVCLRTLKVHRNVISCLIYELCCHIFNVAFPEYLNPES